MSSAEVRASMIQPVPLITKIGYGMGHVFNDLCASMWFTYLLLFFHKVVGMDNTLAGTLLLIGQVADALATPFVGYESDRVDGFCRYSKRKSWHLVGTICVAISFPFIFMVPLTTDPLNRSMIDNSSLMHVVYYAPFIIMFQFGWASTQISHLSIIPELTKCEHDRVGLNSIRYGMTVVANLTVYALALLLLSIGCQTMAGGITVNDYTVFRDLVLIVVGLGMTTSLIFHFTVKEQTDNQRLLTEQSLTQSVKQHMSVTDWLRTPQFYAVGLLYMCTRLVINISQVYLTMFLTETVYLSKQYIAIVPLVVYVFGFISTLFIRFLTKSVGKKKLYLLGSIICISTSIFYRFQPNMVNYKYTNYLSLVAGSVNGVGGSIILIVSLSLTADLIDHNTESGAFVYGAMSFTDKLSNGITVQIIQLLHPCKQSACCAACEPFYRSIMTYVPAGFSVLAILTLLLIRRRQTVYVESDSDSSKHSLIQNGDPPSYGSIEPSVQNRDPDMDPSPVRHSLINTPEPRSTGSYKRPNFIVGSESA